MSVVASKRGLGHLAVSTKANELASYTIKICSNEKNFPKRYRWCLTEKIVDSAIAISVNVTMGLSVVITCSEDYQTRRQYQNKALAKTYSLLSLIDIAYLSFGVKDSRVQYWTGLITEVQVLIRGWREADHKRYKHL